MPLKPVRTVRRWELWLPYILVVAACIFGFAQESRTVDSLKRETHTRQVQVCQQSQHVHDQWTAIAQRIDDSTNQNPAATPEQRVRTRDFTDYLRKLNGPVVQCPPK